MPQCHHSLMKGGPYENILYQKQSYACDVVFPSEFWKIGNAAIMYSIPENAVQMTARMSKTSASSSNQSPKARV